LRLANSDYRVAMNGGTCKVMRHFQAYRIVGCSSVRLAQEESLHVVERRNIHCRLKLAAHFSNKYGEQVASITHGVQITEGVVHAEPQATSLVALQNQKAGSARFT
jgi:hypothetical protein